MNTLKTMVLMVFLTVFFIFVGSVIGGKHGATIALIMAFGMNFFAYFFSHKVVLTMYGAKEVTEA
ncbi:MAG: protease HtpX, partial [Thermodesulfovibrio sp.]